MLKNILNRFLHKMAFLAPGGHGLRPSLHRMRGVKIGNNVWISQFVYIDELHPEAVTIGDNCSIGLRTSIFTHFYWGPRRADYSDGKVVIEKDVFIGPHCVILPNVRIGQGSVIKAGSVVTRDVPPHIFWGQPPCEALARVTVPLTPEHPYEEFMAGLRPLRRKRTE
jgi:acetyltransferase-like isoleucine patch superfamily enzyme